jgi:5-methylcytosine-specific restriction endonuclease McrA
MAGANAGRRGGRWRKLHAEQKAKRLPCWLCGQPIDYAAHKDDPKSFSVDHEKSRLSHPHLAEEPTNLRSAHAGCNKSRGPRAPQPSLGSTSRDW